MNDMDLSVAMVNAAQARWRAYGAEMERQERIIKAERKRKAIKAASFLVSVIMASAAGFTILFGMLAIANIMG